MKEKKRDGGRNTCIHTQRESSEKILICSLPEFGKVLKMASLLLRLSDHDSPIVKGMTVKGMSDFIIKHVMFVK